MYIVIVKIHVKPQYIDNFISATLRNAEFSIQEPGVVRFDFIQNIEKSNKFILIEIYTSKEAHLGHKITDHYKIWKKEVAEMMLEPRTSSFYENIFPKDNIMELEI